MADERTSILRRAAIVLVLVLVIAFSAGIGLLVANWPDCLRYLTARH